MRFLAFLLFAVILIVMGWLYIAPTTDPVRPSSSLEQIPAANPDLPAQLDADADADAGKKRALLQILDSVDSTPVAGAIVNCRDANGEEVEEWTSTAGGGISPNLSPKMAWPLSLEIAAPGYLSRSVALADFQGPQVIYIDRWAAVTVKFVNEQGEPVEGVPAALLPPLQDEMAWGEEWRTRLRDFQERAKSSTAKREDLAKLDNDPEVPAEVKERIRELMSEALLPNEVSVAAEILESCPPENWIRFSDDQGTIRWQGLIPGHVYHWGCTDPSVPIDLDPEPQNQWPQEVTGESTTVEWQFDSTGDTSGPMKVAVAEELQFTATVYIGTGVVGRIETPPGGWAGNVLKTYDVVIAGGMRNVPLEHLVIPDQTGAFAFLGIEPGLKEITGYARDGDDRYHFFCHEVEVPAGEVIDVGVLKSTRGHNVMAVVELQSDDGERVDPREMAPFIQRDIRDPAAEPVAVDPEDVKVSLLVHNTPNVPSPCNGLVERLMVPFDQPFELIGFQPGRNHFDMIELEAYPNIDSDWQFRRKQKKQIDFALPVDGMVTIPLSVTKVTNVKIRVLFPQELDYLSIFLSSEDGMEQVKVGARPRRGELFVEKEVRIPWNDYRVIVVPQSGLSTANFAGVHRITRDELDGQVVELVLAPAATMIGVVHPDLRKDDQIVQFKYIWGTEQKSERVYARCDEDGHFTIHGVIPGAVVEEFMTRRRFTTPAAGETMEVTIEND
ncbi:MAG: hypothetical protein VX764_06815 [Planctomycetota bacterium]|nr:hypothetical protein [Planctomycetota bacterium]